MNKIKPVILIGLAMVVALFITLWIWSRVIHKIEVSGNRKQQLTQPIAVAAIDLPWGSFIARDHIKMVPFLKESLPAGSFSDPDSLKKLIGRTIIYPIRYNEPILESRLAPVTTRDGGVAVLIGEGKRAMAVKVDKVVKKDLEKLAGNPMVVFTCESVINGMLKPYEIKYELGTMKWMLFKI